MVRTSLTLTALVAAAYAAVPNHPFKRATCNRDNCLRAVNNRMSSCSAYFRSTVVLCPVTTTTTILTTVPATVTVSTTESLTTTSSAETTTTATETTSITETEGPITTTSTVLTTSITTLTATTTVSRVAGPAKREVKAVLQLPVPEAVHRRQVTCSPTTSTNPLPTFATACSGSARFSSACSCLGYTATTITVAASTIVVSVTSTATTTNTISETSTDVATEFTTSTIILTSTETLTSTTTLVSSETVSTAGTTTTETLIVATETPAVGPFGLTFGDGGYVNEADTNTPIRVRVPGQGPAVSSLRRRAAGTYNPLFIQANAEFVYNQGTGETPLYLAIPQDSTGFDTVVYQRDPPESRRLVCALADPANRSGRFTCSVNGTPTQSIFYTCGDDQLLYIASAPTELTSCRLRTSDFAAFPGDGSGPSTSTSTTSTTTSTETSTSTEITSTPSGPGDTSTISSVTGTDSAPTTTTDDTLPTLSLPTLP